MRKNLPRGTALNWLKESINKDTDECILWPFKLDRYGYGKIYFRGKSTVANRVALTLSKGEPPTSIHEAAHAPLICHNRACVNPRHLDWKTPKENSADTYLDDTNLRGERNGKAKLTSEMVELILQDNRPQKVIASEFGIATGYVSVLKSRTSWAWLPCPDRCLCHACLGQTQAKAALSKATPNSNITPSELRDKLDAVEVIVVVS